MEEEYKSTKIKAMLKLYSNPDPIMQAVRRYEENAEESGRRALIKDTKRCGRELGLELQLSYPNPVTKTDDNKEVGGALIGRCAKEK